MTELSVIIPAYNCSQYIGHCLDSIFAQTFTDYEVIVVNDGSKDNTAEICDEIAAAHNNMRVIHKINGGAASARNTGIDHARGRHLLFIDADDYLLSESYFSTIMGYSELDYVAAGHTVRWEKSTGEFRESEVNLAACKGLSKESLPDDFYIRGFFHTCWGKLYNTEKIKQYNIRFPSCRVSEDSLFNLSYMEHIQSWAIIADHSYCYMRRGDGKNAIARFEDSDIDVYVDLHTRLKRILSSSRIVRRTMYPQYLACCLRIQNDRHLTKKSKKKKIRALLSKQYVMSTLLFTINNPGEWLLGLKTVFLALI